jgi:acetyl esterase/lipase
MNRDALSEFERCNKACTFHGGDLIEFESHVDVYVTSETQNVAQSRSHKTPLHIMAMREGLVHISASSEQSSDIVLAKRHPGGQILLQFRRKVENGDGKREELFIDVFSRGVLCRSVSVGKKHGSVYTDHSFQRCSWYGRGIDDGYFMYTAECPAEKKTGYFDNVPDDNDNDAGSGEIGSKFIWQENFGENYGDFCQPNLFVMRLHDGEIRPVLPSHFLQSNLFFLGQGSFMQTKLKDETALKVCCVGFDVGATRLGVAACVNRDARIYEFSSPFSPNGESIKDALESKVDLESFLVSSPEHAYCRFPEPASPLSVAYCVHKSECHFDSCDLIIANRSQEGGPWVFLKAKKHPAGGLYVRNAAQPLTWTSQGLLIPCVVRMRETLWLYNHGIERWLEIGDPYEDEGEEEVPSASEVPQHCCLSLLCATRNVCLVDRSSPSEPSMLWMYHFVSEHWMSLTQEQIIPVGMVVSATEVVAPRRVPINIFTPEDPVRIVGIVGFIHGGPHSAITSCFSPAVAFYVACGCAVVVMSYTGSIGLLEEDLLSLPGHIGSWDVEDCYLALEKARMQLEDASGKKSLPVALLGGSHGGFLGAHLIGQYPTAFVAACLRNPVINIASMVDSTDIPDWTYHNVDSALSACGHNVMDGEARQRMWECSPLRYTENVQAHVMLMIGNNDRRVPTFQGLGYAKALRNCGKKVEVYCYPGNGHQFTTPECVSDTTINTWRLFRQAFEQHHNATNVMQ